MQSHPNSTSLSEQLARIADQQCQTAPAKYDDLKALFLNCTLNRTPILSHTRGVINIAKDCQGNF